MFSFDFFTYPVTHPCQRLAFSLQDAEAHGRNKKISANICLLESNPDAHADAPEIPAKILRCVAATVEDAAFVLGCYITEGQPSVSFPAMTQRELMHVPKVKSHGSVHFFNTRRADRVSFKQT